MKLLLTCILCFGVGLIFYICLDIIIRGWGKPDL